jgi:hypothetical protein
MSEEGKSHVEDTDRLAAVERSGLTRTVWRSRVRSIA